MSKAISNNAAIKHYRKAVSVRLPKLSKKQPGGYSTPSNGNEWKVKKITIDHHDVDLAKEAAEEVDIFIRYGYPQRISSVLDKHDVAAVRLMTTCGNIFMLTKNSDTWFD